MASPSEIAAVAALVRVKVRVQFALTADEFAADLAGRAAAAGVECQVADYVSRFQLDDLYLAAACARHDDRAWAEFGARHFAFMRDFARRFLTDAAARDVVDRVIVDLWEKRKLAAYEGRSSLRTWLGAVVAHAALNAAKAARRADDVESRDAVTRRVVGTEATPEETQSARLLGDATRTALEQLAAADKLLLLLHYEQALSLDQIAPLLRTSKATLSRRLKRIRLDVRASIEHVTRERYRTSGDSLREGVDLSRIELDIATLLRGRGGVKGSGGDGV